MFDPRQLQQQRVLDQLAEFIRQRHADSQSQLLIAFGHDYLIDHSIQSLDGINLDALYHDLLNSWPFIERQQSARVATPQWQQVLGNTAPAYQNAFPSAYRDHFSTASAQQDIALLEQLRGPDGLTCSFSESTDQAPGRLHFKLFTTQDSLVLSDVVPILENLGMQVIGEHPYAINRADGQRFWIHDYTLAYQDAGDHALAHSSTLDSDPAQQKQLFQQAFIKTWYNDVENDPFNIQRAMMKELIQLQTRASWWLLRRRRNALSISACIADYQAGIEQTVATLARLQQCIPSQDRWQATFQRYTEVGVPEPLSAYTGASEGLYWLLDIIEAAAELGMEIADVSAVYFKLGEHLNLPWLDRQIRTSPATSHWQALARNSYRDDLDAQQRALTISALRDAKPGESPHATIAAWLEKHPAFIQRWQQVLADMQRSPSVDCAIFTVAINVLFELA